MLGINPYIAFNGTCREAIEFYKSALGAECYSPRLSVSLPCPMRDRPTILCPAPSKAEIQRS
jgi:hypothetical protein